MKRLIVSLAALAIIASGAFVQAKTNTVTTVNNDNPGGQMSLKQALANLQDGDVIQFNIPGTGPFLITTPIGGYPLITANNVTIDGYSQPGASPNSNPILGGNNAKLQIVLDSTDASEATNPENAELPLRRSTRLPYSGYGDSENAIIGVVAGDNCKIRGISFIGRQTPGNDADPSVYCIALVQEATNAKVQGCWFGLAPGWVNQSDVKGCSSAVAAFRYRTGGDVYSSGLVVGTDGDGTNDVAEFNVMVGLHIALAIEAPNLRVSGNYVNVFPDGLTFVDVQTVHYDLMAVGRTGSDASVEFLENGRLTDNTIVGTDGNGKSDGNERNIVAHSYYDVDIEFYSSATNIVVAGNYFGVGVDGVTAGPVPLDATPNLMSLPGNATFRLGSNGDGVSDYLEGNVIVKLPGSMLVDCGASVPVVVRRNKILNSTLMGFPFADGEGGKSYYTYYANALVASILPTPTITDITDGIMSGELPEPNTNNYPYHVVDIYMVDPGPYQMGMGIAGTWVASFTDNSVQDLDKTANKYRIDLRGMPITPGTNIVIAVTYSLSANNTAGTNSITGPASFMAVANMPIIVPGSIESVGLTRIVPDQAIIVPQNDKLGNWEPYAGVLGTTTFLIEGNTFADGFDAPAPDGKQRYVVALQAADGKTNKVVEGFYADDFSPYNGPINASRQNGNPGRVIGDRRPGAVNYMVGAEASPHTLPVQFGSDNRWNLGFDRLVDGRYGTVQTYALNITTLVPTPLMKAADSANGRLTSGMASGNSEITRFGGDIACLDNGNFVSVVEDRTKIRSPKNCITATIFAPDGTVVKDSWVIVKSDTADNDIWSNVTSYKGGFAVRCKPQDSSSTRVIYLFDNAGNLLNTIPQTSSGASFDTGRGDGTRIAGHINSPYIFLAGKMSNEQKVKLAAWDTRDPQRVTLFEVSEPAFVGNNDRVNLAVDALNRVVVAWDSNPDGYELVQVAARVLKLDESSMTISALTSSFFPFINAAKTGGIRTTRMTVAMTTKQICVAAKGEINLDNKPDQGAYINPNTGLPLSEINFYTVFTHPNPQDDPTPPVSSGPEPTLRAQLSGGNITLQWDTSAVGYTLESKANLSDTNWTAIGTQNPTTEAIGTGNKFYRLRK